MANERDYKAIVTQAVSTDNGFLKLTLSGTAEAAYPYVKVVLRPVLIGGERRIQIARFDGKKDLTQNYAAAALIEKLGELLRAPFRHLHLQTTSGDLHVRITKKNRALVKKAKPSRPVPSPDLAHNREKQHLLPANTPDAFLLGVGIMDASGRVKPTMQDKFRQINAFLKLLEQTFAQEENTGETIHIVDCGCGNAYLTFAAYHHLCHIRGFSVNVTGVDANAALIEKCRALQAALEWDGLAFIASRIADFSPDTPPDITLSLHACNTATDEALAQGVMWNSRIILAAPCCQHELRSQIAAALFDPVLRHGILKQRMAEMLTDTCRAQILRILGYRADVVEFIDSKHTPKNILIRAKKTTHPGDQTSVSEYLALRDFWHINPCIERLLKRELESYFQQGHWKTTQPNYLRE